MNLFSNINFNYNFISIIITGIFLIPILVGILRPFSSNRVQNSMDSVLNSIELILGIITSVYFTRVIYSEVGSGFISVLYKVIPYLGSFIARKDIYAYILTILIILFIITSILRLLSIPIHRYIILPLSKGISSAVNSMNCVIKRLIGGIWQLPKSIWLVLAFSLILHFYVGIDNNLYLSEYINNSAVYQYVNEKALYPLLKSDIAKKIPVLFNDSFKKTVENQTPSGKQPFVIIYFNGMTLSDAIESTTEINSAALKIIGKETNDKKKAYLIYNWIRKNIKYDYEKAEIITKNSSGVASGAKVAFSERKGVCFDYSCLYVAMCRAAGLKVRFVTGMGYSGVTWGDHSWNQVYYPAEKRWINVDTTFGSSGYNYFDNKSFSSDHKYDDIQGEW